MVASLGLGIASWVMGQNDPAQDAAGHHGPRGSGKNPGRMVCGIIATSLAGLCGLSEGAFVIWGRTWR